MLLIHFVSLMQYLTAMLSLSYILLHLILVLLHFDRNIHVFNPFFYSLFLNFLVFLLMTKGGVRHKFAKGIEAWSNDYFIGIR